MYIYASVTFGVNIRFCRRECGIGVAVVVEGVHQVVMTRDGAGVSAVADARGTISGVPCAGRVSMFLVASATI
jgi:hypothetical protein